MDWESLEYLFPLHDRELGVVDGLLEVVGQSIAYQLKIVRAVIDIIQNLQKEIIWQIRVVSPPKQHQIAKL